MGRTPLAIDQTEFTQVVLSLDNPSVMNTTKPKGKAKKGDPSTIPLSPVPSFTNRSALFQAVCDSEYGKQLISNGVNLTPINIYNKIKAWNIPLITPVGKKGRQKGQKIEGGGRKKKALDVEFHNRLIKSLKSMDLDKRFAKVAERAASGSLKARICIKCLDCCNGQISEIKNCPSTDCGVYPSRPFKNTTVKSQPATIEEETEPIGEIVSLPIIAP